MAGKGMGALAILMKPKMKSEDDGDSRDDKASGAGDEDKFLAKAFDAVQDGDAESFAAAMRSAIRACIDADKTGEYDEGDEGE